MYCDIISYELAPGVTEDHLLEVTERIYNEWMKDVYGFLGWKICKEEDGKYCDIVMWEDKRSADAAEKDMANLPNVTEWISCYKENSVKTKRVQQIDHLKS